MRTGRHSDAILGRFLPAHGTQEIDPRTLTAQSMDCLMILPCDSRESSHFNAGKGAPGVTVRATATS